MEALRRLLAVTLLLILLADLCFFPLSYAQLPTENQQKTKGSVVVLTAETPPELQIYHRALILPRYRLDRTHGVEKRIHTANVDFFQISLITVDNQEIRVEKSPPNGSQIPPQYLRTPAYILFFFCLTQVGCHLLRLLQARQKKKEIPHTQ